MVVFYGTRSFGRVDQHAGEYAATTFFHIYLLPLIPTGSMWITDAVALRGYKIPLHARSVIAAYLRIWGLVAGIGLLAAGLGGSGPLLAAGVGALALSAWSWTWRSLRGPRALRRSDLNYIAFGARCDPQHLPVDLRGALKAELDARWDAAQPERTPNEVAQHGSNDARELAIAYGLLRLGAIERGAAGTDEAADAQRILDGEHAAVPDTADGPYRAAAAVPSESTSFAELVAERAARVAARNIAVAEAPLTFAAQQDHARATRRRWYAGLAFAAVLACIGASRIIAGLDAPRPIGAAQLGSISPPVDTYVRVACDSPAEAYLSQRGTGGIVVMLCSVGKLLLPIVASKDVLDQDLRVLEGTLRVVPEGYRAKEAWAQQLRMDRDVEPHTYEVYLDMQGDSPTEKFVVGGVLLLIAAGTLGWFLRWRRKNAALLTS